MEWRLSNLRKNFNVSVLAAGPDNQLTVNPPASHVLEAGELLVRVTKDKAEADVIKVKVSADAAEGAIQAAETTAISDDAQKDLDVALPALKAAEEALSKLDKKDINEVKSFPKPPPAVVPLDATPPG